MKIRFIEVNNIVYQFASGAMWTSIKLGPEKKQHGTVPETHKVETMIRTPEDPRELEPAVMRTIKETVNQQLKAVKTSNV